MWEVFTLISFNCRRAAQYPRRVDEPVWEKCLVATVSALPCDPRQPQISICMPETLIAYGRKKFFSSGEESSTI